MKKEFISKGRILELEETIGWLSEYTAPDEKEKVEHVVGESIQPKDIDSEATQVLKEIGLLNSLRLELIKKLINLCTKG